jgi:hypothetical protein
LAWTHFKDEDRIPKKLETKRELQMIKTNANPRTEGYERWYVIDKDIEEN